MARAIHPDTAAALERDNVATIVLVGLDWPGGASYVHSGIGDLHYDGNTWIGVGDLGSISGIEEPGDLEAGLVRLILNGVDPAQIHRALSANYQGREAQILLALVEDSGAMIGEPVLLYRGQMDQLIGTLGATGQLTLSLGDALAYWESGADDLWTHESQQNHYPGDRGFEFLPGLQDQEIVW